MLLQASGLSILDTDDRGWTVLHHAVTSGSPEATRFLFSEAPRGAMASMAWSVADGGWTPLHIAVAHGNAKAVELLLKATDRDTTHGVCYAAISDHDGMGALHFAAMLGREDVAGLLLSRLGAQDIVLKDTTGATALHIAAQQDKDAVARMIFAKWPRPTPVKELVDAKGLTPADIAAAAGRHDLAELLASVHEAPSDPAPPASGSPRTFGRPPASRLSSSSFSSRYRSASRRRRSDDATTSPQLSSASSCFANHKSSIITAAIMAITAVCLALFL